MRMGHTQYYSDNLLFVLVVADVVMMRVNVHQDTLRLE